MEKFLKDYIRGWFEGFEEYDDINQKDLVNRIMNDDYIWTDFDNNILDIVKEMREEVK